MLGVIFSFAALAILVIIDIFTPRTARRARLALLVMIGGAIAAVVGFGAVVFADVLYS